MVFLSALVLLLITNSSSFALQMNENSSQNECEVGKDDCWPNLFAEVCDAAVAAMSVFAIADLRFLARKGELSETDAEEVLHHLPLRADKLRALWERNEDSLRARVRSGDFADVVDPYAAALKDEHWQALEVHYVGDDNSEEECVYVIMADSIDRAITVSFRGTITFKDWMQDAKFVFGSIPNPVARLAPEQPEELKVHLGFRDYLYGESPSMFNSLLSSSSEKKSNRVAKEKTDERQKVTVILDQLHALHLKHPDYKVYVTGHSLGGALATLFALEAAVLLKDEPYPVTCIALGNPMVGNDAFRSAVNLLEAENKLRTIGIHNFLDVVPVIFDNVVSAENGNNYCHAGMKMLLYKDHFEVSYLGREPETKRTLWRRISHRVNNFMQRLPIHFRSWSFHKGRWVIHDYREYFERLMAQKEELSKLHLNDMYEKEKLGTADEVCSAATKD